MKAVSARFVPLLAAVLSVAALPAAVSAKCGSLRLAMPGMAPGAPVLFLDGRVVPNVEAVEPPERASPDSDADAVGAAADVLAVSLPELDPAEVHSVRLVCWNPETGEISTDPTGINVFFVLTYEHVLNVRAPLEAFVAIQSERALAASNRVAGAQGRPRVSRSPLVELEQSAAGWSAATFAGVSAARCYVAVGDAPRAVEGMEDGEIVCRPDYTQAERMLRVMYEGEAAETR